MKCFNESCIYSDGSSFCKCENVLLSAALMLKIEVGLFFMLLVLNEVVLVSKDKLNCSKLEDSLFYPSV